VICVRLLTVNGLHKLARFSSFFTVYSSIVHRVSRAVGKITEHEGDTFIAAVAIPSESHNRGGSELDTEIQSDKQGSFAGHAREEQSRHIAVFQLAER
jgi:hypothetical protein